MARNSERRAALAARMGRAVEDAPSVVGVHRGVTRPVQTSNMMREMTEVLEAATLRNIVHRASVDDPEEQPMKIQFQSVNLHKAIPRLGPSTGLATHSSTFFTASMGVEIELDTAAQVVRLTNAKGNAIVHVPVAGVERFGPTLGDIEAGALPVKTA